MVAPKILVLAFETEFLLDMWAFGGSKRAEYMCVAIHLLKICEGC